MPLKPQHGRATLSLKNKCQCKLCAAYRDKKRAKHRRWYWKHRERECKKNSQRAKLRYENNSDEIKASVSKWRKENKDKVNEIEQRRRARKQNKLGKVPKNIVSILWKEQNGLCFYKGEDLSITGVHLDHKTPLVRGGFHDKNNLCLACPSCNLHKNAQTAKEFLKSQNARNGSKVVR